MIESRRKVKRLFFWIYFRKFFGFFAGILNHFNNDRRIMIVKGYKRVWNIGPIAILFDGNTSVCITKNFHCGAFCQSCHISNS